MKASTRTHEIFLGLERLFLKKTVLSISGESGTGKTTFALYLVGKLLHNEESCIWIQAGEEFPIRRLEQIFKFSPIILNRIKKNTFLIPEGKLIHSYQEQSLLIQKIFNQDTVLPPSIKIIVIDNISHHLRYKVTHTANPIISLSLLDDFYETQLLPLILFCKRNKIILVLIHENTYNPKLEICKPFFYKLYDRLDTIDIILTNIFKIKKKILELSVDKSKWNFQYTLGQLGITIF
ncbi:MAG: hypothetical protein ACFFEY_03690 [Candidatus Thorarchaeota archaeon]